MQHGTIVILGIVLAAMLGVLPTAVFAAPPEYDQGQIYVVQADDWLGTLADKFYGSPLAYPVILEATNAKASQDDRYGTIDNPYQITIGQALFVPTLDNVPDEFLAEAPLERNQAMPSDDILVSNTGPTAEQLELLNSLEIVGQPPELHNEIWLNSDQLKLADLKGKVVIVEFWTFG